MRNQAKVNLANETEITGSLPMSNHTKITVLSAIICILGASFYMYEFMLQVSLGVMTADLMHDLLLNASTLGIVSACYYYAYMPMQIPAGILHDRFGPHLMLTFAILVCAMGSLVFSFSTHVWEAALGRFMMGLGSAFSFSGALMLISRWFPPQYFAILSGIVQLMSSIGAITGEVPLAIAIKRWDWPSTMMYIGFIGVGLALLVWLVVRDYPKDATNNHSNNHIETIKPRLKYVFGRWQSWYLAIYSFSIWAPIAAFAGLWGIPFLIVSYHLSLAAASATCAAIWIGIGVGSPLVGWISEHIGRRRIVLNVCGFLGIISTFLMIYVQLSMPLLYLALFVFGLAASGQSLAFSVVRDINYSSILGAAIGFNNMATVAGGAILQPIIGFILDQDWDGTIINNTPIYNLHNYQLALMMLPICYCLSFVISFLIRETYCKQDYP